MKKIYNKTTRELIKDFIQNENILISEKFQRSRIKSWFQNNYPKIKIGTIDAHITRMTVNAPSRVHYNVFDNGSDDLFLQLEDGTLRLFDKTKDPTPIYKKEDSNNVKGLNNDKDEIDTESSQEFAYEKDLKNYLSKNLNLIETGLKLYEDEGINGIEFDAGGRFIDILAMDKDDNYVVIELKVSKGYDKVVGQILRYIGWIKNNLSESDKIVRGIIIARSISDDLKIACSQLDMVKLFEYNLSVTLKQL